MADNLYILGHPVAHSKSPAMHNAAYRALGLDWEYGFADCATEAQAGEFLAGGGWVGLNVTMPYKPLAYGFATERTREARLACGANVLIRRGDGVFADNTDGKGCVSYLRRRGVDFEDAAVAVCGTGPTSLAIMHAAAEAGASRVSLMGRGSAKAQEALDSYLSVAPCADGVSMHAGSYDGLREEIAATDVVIDATPLGMHAGDPAPFDVSLLSPDQAVFDVVYGHGETALVAAARRLGCATYDGAGMLVAQAVETVHDLARVTGSFEVPDTLDLFSIMAKAAGFVSVSGV